MERASKRNEICGPDTITNIILQMTSPLSGMFSRSGIVVASASVGSLEACRSVSCSSSRPTVDGLVPNVSGLSSMFRLALFLSSQPKAGSPCMGGLPLASLFLPLQTKLGLSLSFSLGLSHFSKSSIQPLPTFFLSFWLS